MKRLFIAFTLSHKTISEIATLQNKIRCRLGSSPNWVSPKNFHMTIKFLGNTDSSVIPEIEKAMFDIVSSQTSTTVSLESIGAFPNANRPRVLWLGISNNSFIFDTFQKLDQRMAELSFPRETKPYHPHITIARFKNPLNNFMNVYEEFKNVCIGNETITTITLYESKIIRREVVYESLTQVKTKV